MSKIIKISQIVQLSPFPLDLQGIHHLAWIWYIRVNEIKLILIL